jgi:nitrite reductase/ring-hydroxylating ferredoxin subunit
LDSKIKIVFVLSEEFVTVADTTDIQPSHMKEVQVDGENICVVNVEGKYTLLAVFAHMKVVL